MADTQGIYNARRRTFEGSSGATELRQLLAAARSAGQRLDLSGSTLKDLDLGVGFDMHDVILQGADLRGIDAPGASFVGADLSFAHLEGARMPGADFSSATMMGVETLAEYDTSERLFGSPHRAADLTGCIVAGADFTGARLRSADLSAVDWTHAILFDTEVDGPDSSKQGWHNDAPGALVSDSPADGGTVGDLVPADYGELITEAIATATERIQRTLAQTLTRPFGLAAPVRAEEFMIVGGASAYVSAAAALRGVAATSRNARAARLMLARLEVQSAMGRLHEDGSVDRVAPSSSHHARLELRDVDLLVTGHPGALLPVVGMPPGQSVNLQTPSGCPVQLDRPSNAHRDQFWQGGGGDMQLWSAEHPPFNYGDLFTYSVPTGYGATAAGLPGARALSLANIAAIDDGVSQYRGLHNTQPLVASPDENPYFRDAQAAEVRELISALAAMGVEVAQAESTYVPGETARVDVLGATEQLVRRAIDELGWGPERVVLRGRNDIFFQHAGAANSYAQLNVLLEPADRVLFEAKLRQLSMQSAVARIDGQSSVWELRPPYQFRAGVAPASDACRITVTGASREAMDVASSSAASGLSSLVALLSSSWHGALEPMLATGADFRVFDVVVSPAQWESLLKGGLRPVAEQGGMPPLVGEIVLPLGGPLGPGTARVQVTRVSDAVLTRLRGLPQSLRFTPGDAGLQHRDAAIQQISRIARQTELPAGERELLLEMSTPVLAAINDGYEAARGQVAHQIASVDAAARAALNDASPTVRRIVLDRRRDAGAVLRAIAGMTPEARAALNSQPQSAATATIAALRLDPPQV